MANRTNSFLKVKFKRGAVNEKLERIAKRGFEGISPVLAGAAEGANVFYDRMKSLTIGLPWSKNSAEGRKAKAYFSATPDPKATLHEAVYRWRDRAASDGEKVKYFIGVNVGKKSAPDGGGHYAPHWHLVDQGHMFYGDKESGRNPPWRPAFKKARPDNGQMAAGKPMFPARPVHYLRNTYYGSRDEAIRAARAELLRRTTKLFNEVFK